MRTRGVERVVQARRGHHHRDPAGGVHQGEARALGAELQVVDAVVGRCRAAVADRPDPGADRRCRRVVVVDAGGDHVADEEVAFTLRGRDVGERIGHMRARTVGPDRPFGDFGREFDHPRTEGGQDDGR